MRIFTVGAVAAMLLAALAAPNAAPPGLAATERTLDGWQQFKFGMNREEARAVPGVSWERDVGVPPPTTMQSLPMTSEYGPDTHVALDFNADQKLQEVKLTFKDTQSAADCDKAFLNLLTRSDAKYGAFAPGGERDEWTVQGAMSGGGLLENTTALKLSGSRSGYWHRTILPNISELNVEAEAKRSFGARWIELEMFQKDGKEGCFRSVTFWADMPSKAQQEVQFKLKHVPADMDWHWAEMDRFARGFSSGPAQTDLSSGAAENVKLGGGRFAADVKRPPGSKPGGTLHLVGTISGNKISAHVRASDAVSDDFPTSFEGDLSMFTTDGEPVDTYEISLTGTGRLGSISLEMAAYHRTGPHTPAASACAKVTEDAYTARRSPREMTYKGLLQALGCPP